MRTFRKGCSMALAAVYTFIYFIIASFETMLASTAFAGRLALAHLCGVAELPAPKALKRRYFGRGFLYGVMVAAKKNEILSCTEEGFAAAWHRDFYRRCISFYFACLSVSTLQAVYIDGRDIILVEEGFSDFPLLDVWR